MLELTAEQIAVLERLRDRGFQFVAYPLYASYVGVRKNQCAVLLAPVEGGGLRIFGEASYLVDGNLSVRVTRGGRAAYVWKQKSLEATPEREEELSLFRAELEELLSPRA